MLNKRQKFTPIYTQNRVAVVSSTESTPLNEIQKNIDKYFDVTSNVQLHILRVGDT